MKSSVSSWRDDRMNGKLKISIDGAVFILPIHMKHNNVFESDVWCIAPR